MGFHALFEREDVLNILQKTLQEYYCSRFPDKNVYIGYEKREGAAEFFLTPRVGMILQAHPAKDVCQRFYSSYNIRNNVVKHITAKALVFMGLHFPQLTAMKTQLYVWPGDLVNAKTVFDAKELGDDGRILVRESGTEPLIRVMVEAATDELCAKYVNSVIDVIYAEGLAAE